MIEMLTQIQEAWSALSGKQRLMLLFTFAVTVAAVGGAVWWARQPSFAVLYTGMDPKDAQAVVQELEARKIPHRLHSGGGTVEVPMEQVDRLRMDLAAKNTVSSGRFGFLEMFSQDNIAQSNQSQRIRFQKALEDELARTIESLAEVKTARVHLVLPGDRVFIDDKDVAKASVTLSLGAGTSLSSEQVQAIARIVAGAVPELSLDRVSVVDTAGRVLWEGDGEGSLSGPRQIEMKAAVEKDFNSKVGRVLEPVIGANRFVVRTSANLDFQRSVRKEMTYDPETGVLISEEKRKERTDSNSGGGGVPGTASNLPGSGGTGGATSGENSEKQDQKSNFQYSSVEKTVEEPVGALTRISVAVLVDTNWEGDGTAEGAARRPVPRSDDEIAKIEGLVKAAISFDAGRGDVITVEQAPFQQAPAVVETKGFDWMAYLPYLRYPLLAVLLLMVFTLFFKPFLRLAGDALARGRQFTIPGAAAAESQLQAPPSSAVELMRQRLSQLASEQPEGMAQTVRVWLNEPKK